MSMKNSWIENNNNEGSAIEYFVETFKNDNEIARDFPSRMEVLEYKYSLSQISQIIFTKLISGRYSASHCKTASMDCRNEKLYNEYIILKI